MKLEIQRGYLREGNMKVWTDVVKVEDLRALYREKLEEAEKEREKALKEDINCGKRNKDKHPHLQAALCTTTLADLRAVDKNIKFIEELLAELEKGVKQ